MAPASITILLELDPAADRPVGIARLPDGTSRAFQGWLRLVEAIDTALAGDRPSTVGPQERQDPRTTDTKTGASQ